MFSGTSPPCGRLKIAQHLSAGIELSQFAVRERTADWFRGNIFQSPVLTGYSFVPMKLPALEVLGYYHSSASADWNLGY
jgi:hypothetical protein